MSNLSVFLLMILSISSYSSPLILGGKSLAESKFPATIEFGINKLGRDVTCTASFISSNTLITAAHCVSFLNSACEKEHVKSDQLTIVDKTNLNATLVVKEIITQEDSHNDLNFQASEDECHKAINPRYDTALIILNKKTNHPTISVSSSFPDTANKKYLFIGYGQSFINDIEDFSRKWFHNYKNQSDFSSKKQIGYFEIIQQNQAMPHESAFTDYLKGKVYDSSTTHHLLPGDSGGPLIDECGEIIGIASMFNKINIINPETDFIMGYKMKSYFAPLHRTEFRDLIDLAIMKGSTYTK